MSSENKDRSRDENIEKSFGHCFCIFIEKSGSTQNFNRDGKTHIFFILI